MLSKQDFQKLEDIFAGKKDIETIKTIENDIKNEIKLE
jgi:hypothetical protein